MARPPNILWYCTDQQRFDTLGFLGYDYARTPRLDAFAQRATTFMRAYCQSPICTPSRASFLTGMYPSALAVNGNGVARFPRHYEDRLVPHRLAAAGYDCGLVGKLHLAAAARDGVEERVDDGYRFFKYSHDHKGPERKGHDYAEWIREQGEDPSRFLRETITPKQYEQGSENPDFSGFLEPTEEKDNVPPQWHQTRWCTEQAKAFIDEERAGGQPWFLSVNVFDPHPPYDAPWEYYRRYDPEQLPGAHWRDSDMQHQQRLTEAGIDFQSKPKHPEALRHRHLRASYLAMVEQIDTEFGRLLDHLEAVGQLQDTIVIFTSDHGEMLGDHGLTLKGCRFYEGLTRVPLMVSWPGRFGEGRVTDALVELVDLAPTLYEEAGLERPYWLHGESLSALLKGEGDARRESVRCEYLGAVALPDQTRATMYRDDRWKLVRYHNKDLCELYDLESDPWEHEDLSEKPEYADKLAELVRKSFDAAVEALPKGLPREYKY